MLITLATCADYYIVSLLSGSTEAGTANKRGGEEILCHHLSTASYCPVSTSPQEPQVLRCPLSTLYRYASLDVIRPKLSQSRRASLNVRGGPFQWLMLSWGECGGDVTHPASVTSDFNTNEPKGTDRYYSSYLSNRNWFYASGIKYSEATRSAELSDFRNKICIRTNACYRISDTLALLVAQEHFTRAQGIDFNRILVKDERLSVFKKKNNNNNNNNLASETLTITRPRETYRTFGLYL